MLWKLLKHINNILQFNLIEENPQLPAVGELDKFPVEWAHEYLETRQMRRLSHEKHS